MEQRTLGRTGHTSSVAILGGAAFGTRTAAEAEAGFRLALERGVNHLDIAPSYGAAERLIGPLVPAVRDQLFLGCKTHRRNPEGVRSQFADTCAFLGVDHVDLYQLHGVTSVEVLDQRMDALDELLRIRDAGGTRFVGITGHDMTAPATFIEALGRADLDTVMFPIYPRLWADEDYRRDAEALLAICAQRNLGVMAIKAAASRPWSSASGEPWADSWYEPAGDAVGVARGVHFALSVPGVHAFCTPGDLGVLPLALDAADGFALMDVDEMAAAVAAQADEALIFPMPVA